MSDKLVLTKQGFKAWKWDGAARGEHRHKTQEDGSVVVLDCKTKQEIARYPNSDEAEKSYWIERDTENHCWLTELRSSPEIEEGVTVWDFIEAIQTKPELNLFVEALFGEWWGEYFASKNLGIVEVFREGKLVGDQLRLLSVFSNKFSEEETFTVRKNIVIENLGVDAEYDMSLLEIIDSFGQMALSAVGDTGIVSRHIPVYLRDLDGDIALYWANGEKIDNPLLTALHPVEILCDEQLTIQRLFKWVSQHDILKHFVSAYSWCREIDAFHSEAELPYQEDDQEKLKRAVVARSIELDKFRGTLYFTEGLDFRCYGDVSEETKEAYLRSGGECPQEEAYGISFSPVHHYAHLPLVLDTKVDIAKSAVYSRKGNRLEDEQILATVDCLMTLLEFLDAIYWEISFNGGPVSRDEALQDLSERADECKKLSEPDAKIKTYSSFEEMLKDNKEDGPWDGYRIDRSLDTTPDDDEI